MTAGLQEMRDQIKRRRKAPSRPAWTRPVVKDFCHDVSVLAWDATLSHCGWVLAEVTDGVVCVHDRGIINTETEMTGYLGTWEKARLLRGKMRPLLETYRASRQVVEAPAVKGSRLESSLIAGLLLWLETEGPDGPACVQISRTHVAAVMCGNPRLPSADLKRATRESCAIYVPSSGTRDWNEHQRDALAVALTYLHDLGR